MVDLGEGHRGPGPPLFWVKNKKQKQEMTEEKKASGAIKLNQLN